MSLDSKRAAVYGYVRGYWVWKCTKSKFCWQHAHPPESMSVFVAQPMEMELTWILYLRLEWHDLWVFEG